MNRMRMLVPSAGRKVALLRELERYFEVYAGGPGVEIPACRLHANGRYVSLPDVSDPGYQMALLDAVRRLGIGVILPVRNEDMYALSPMHAELMFNGAMLVMTRGDTARACNDKLALQSFISQGIERCSEVIKRTTTVELHDWTEPDDRLGFPMFLKPRFGSGSRKSQAIYSADDLIKTELRVNMVVQPLLRGQEYTADMFFDAEHKLVQTVLRRRDNVSEGQMDHGEIVEDFFTPLTSVDKPGGWNSHGFLGPINVQFFKCDDGIIRITDINPRFGGGTVMTIRSGADFVRYLHQMLSCQPITVTQPVLGMQARSYIDYVLGKD